MLLSYDHPDTAKKAKVQATTLRQNAGRPCPFGAKWLFSRPPPQQTAGQTSPRGCRRKRRDWDPTHPRQPTAAAHTPTNQVWTGPSMLSGRRPLAETLRPAEARRGRAERPHCAKTPATRGAVARCGRYSDATTLRQNAARPCRFGAQWSFSPPPPQQKMPGRPTNEAAARSPGKRGAGRQPKPPAKADRPANRTV